MLKNHPADISERSTKENNEDPTKSEMFVVTRTNSKGKEVDSETKDVISKLQNRQEAREIDEHAFQTMFGKEQPGQKAKTIIYYFYEDLEDPITRLDNSNWS